MKTFEQVQAAAQAGDAASQDLLAQALEQMGRIDEALAWWMKAAKSGFPAAHAKLGLWQLVGFKLPQNSQEGGARIRSDGPNRRGLGLVDEGGQERLPRRPRQTRPLATGRIQAAAEQPGRGGADQIGWAESTRPWLGG